MKKWHNRLTKEQQSKVKSCQVDVKQVEALGSKNVYASENAILIALLANMLDEEENEPLPKIEIASLEGKKWVSQLSIMDLKEISYCQDELSAEKKSFSRRALLIMKLVSKLSKIEDSLLPINSPTQAPSKIRTIAEVLGFDGEKLAKGEIPE